jgi:hypothetical protein
VAEGRMKYDRKMGKFCRASLPTFFYVSTSTRLTLREEKEEQNLLVRPIFDDKRRLILSKIVLFIYGKDFLFQ